MQFCASKPGFVKSSHIYQTLLFIPRQQNLAEYALNTDCLAALNESVQKETWLGLGCCCLKPKSIITHRHDHLSI